MVEEREERRCRGANRRRRRGRCGGEEEERRRKWRGVEEEETDSRLLGCGGVGVSEEQSSLDIKH